MKKVTVEDGEGQIIEKKSRFIGEIRKASTPEEALALVESVRKKYFDAKHHCFAYVCGADGEKERYSDDGEPQGTAGQPLLSLLKAGDITDSVIIVTRYFGGVLLGPGGLVRAYTAAGEAAIKNAKLASMVTGTLMTVSFPFKDENTVRNICRNLSQNDIHLEIKDVAYSDRCDMTVICEKTGVEAFKKNVTDTLAGGADITEDEDTTMLI